MLKTIVVTSILGRELVMKRVRWMWTFAIAMGILLSPIANLGVSAQSTSDQIVGTWKYVTSEQVKVPSGETIRLFGDHPGGYIAYHKSGAFFFAQFAEKRPKASMTPIPDQEKIGLFNTMSSGYGTFKVEGDVLTVSYANSWHTLWDGTTARRKLKIEGKILTLVSDTLKHQQGFDYFFRNTFERID